MAAAADEIKRLNARIQKLEDQQGMVCFDKPTGRNAPLPGE